MRRGPDVPDCRRGPKVHGGVGQESLSRRRIMKVGASDYWSRVNLARRNLSKGQQAMALAMLYPEGERGRGKNAAARKAQETTGFSSERLRQARSVLHHSRALAESVLGAGV
jgi:hypothetical protein